MYEHLIFALVICYVAAGSSGMRVLTQSDLFDIMESSKNSTFNEKLEFMQRELLNQYVVNDHNIPDVKQKLSIIKHQFKQKWSAARNTKARFLNNNAEWLKGCIALPKADAPAGYVRYEQADGWLKLHTTPTTWRSARLTCFEEGAVLASPENEALLEAMSGVMLTGSKSPEYIFTGIHDTFSKGLFYSLKGTPLSKIPSTWAPGKPTGTNEESCISMHSQGMLVDSPCNEELPFICYKKDPAPKYPSCGPADNGYVMNKKLGSCYKFHKEPVYWKDAFATCVAEKAHLAIINGNKEAQFLTKLFNEYRPTRREGVPDWLDNEAHIGFVDWGREGGLWMTIEGETLEDAGYLKWNQGEPNNATNQFCGAMFDNGRFDDVNCYDGDPEKWTRYFICEKKIEYVKELPNATPSQ